MREKQVSATEFKAKCLGLLDEVASGTSLVITKRGKPVGMAGTAEEAGDIVHFDSSEMWELLR